MHSPSPTIEDDRTEPQPPALAPDRAADLVPVRRRHDGWTAERQRVFLTALAQSGNVAEAAAVAGISKRSAFRLRTHPEGQAFARAWDAALMTASNRLLAVAFERALAGERRQVWRDGRLVAEQVVPSDRMLMFLLRHLNPEMFGYDGPAPRRATAIAALQNDFGEAAAALVDSDVEADPADPADLPPAGCDTTAHPVTFGDLRRLTPLAPPEPPRLSVTFRLAPPSVTPPTP